MCGGASENMDVCDRLAANLDRTAGKPPEGMLRARSRGHSSRYGASSSTGEAICGHLRGR